MGLAVRVPACVCLPGKELIARALHFAGARADKPFIEINCASSPSNLLEAELFGYERGAFTDAKERKQGLIETAEGGTPFLDEIGEAHMAVQVKLLKLLEEKCARRLGGAREQPGNVRELRNATTSSKRIRLAIIYSRWLHD